MVKNCRSESWHCDATGVNLNFYRARHLNWREISSKIRVPVFSGINLIGGLIFGSIGFVAFIYGKRLHLWKPIFLGIALMAYPYFVEDDIVLFAIGVLGTAALFLSRD